jgi:hypothetical protein
MRTTRRVRADNRQMGAAFGWGILAACAVVVGAFVALRLGNGLRAIPLVTLPTLD